MKLVIFSRSPSLYSTRRLGLVGLARGHDVRVVDPLRCSLVLRRGKAEIFAKVEPLGDVDAVITRIGPSSSAHALAILRQVELTGAACLNGAEAILRARDKLRTFQLLAQRGIGVVPTALARHPADVRHAIGKLGGPPTVVKFSDGAQGTGVMLADTLQSAESVIEALVSVHRNLLIQEFVPHDADARLFVVGRKVVAAIRRVPCPGNFRANLHQGGCAVALQPSAAQTEAALAAAKVVGLEIAGVDLIDTPDGPLVMEVNASPGLEGIESASGRNVAGAILQLVEHHVRARHEAGAPA